MFGYGTDEKGQATSQVDMEVDRPKPVNFRLDLDGTVPAAPEIVESRTDPSAAFETRFRELEDKLIAMQKAPKPQEVSLAKIQELLNAYNVQVTEKIEAQSRALQAENERLRQAEAQRLEDERLAGDADKRRQDAAKAKKDLATKQVESNGVVVDESSEDVALPGSSGPATGSIVTNNNLKFLADASNDEFKTSVSKPLANPAKTVVQGTIISGVLETAINTELPGNIRGQVTEPVFSYDGTHILMPAGTVLIGTFNTDIHLEQKRVLIAWNRAITPEGQSIALGSTGTDLLGRSGTAGNVDNRYMKKIGAAVLISAINVVPSMISASLNKVVPAPAQNSSQPNLTLNVGTTDNSSGEAATTIGGALAEQSSNILGQYLDLPPVIRVPQGEEIRIFVNRDLVFR